MDLLSDILARMKLSGTLYFRTSFTSPWSIQVPAYENVCRFHIAHRGRCFVRVEGEDEPVQLEQGDLIIVPWGAAHTMFCDPNTQNKAVQLDRVLEESGFTGSGVLVYGEFGTDQETQLVCGHFAFDKHAKHPLISALPAYIHVKNYGEEAGNWMENTLRVIGAEAGRGRMGSDLIALKLSEIIFAQTLRTYLETDGAEAPVLAGFADKAIARVLQAVHTTPAHPWSLDELSKIAGMSRTSFTEKFTACLSMTPLAYITQWRMQIARELLQESKVPIIEVAEQSGYQSEAAFGRVFKKQFGETPATFRREAHMS